MSNLIKSGFVAFSQNKAMVIDANDSKIIKGIEEAIQEAAIAREETSMEDALAEAMIEDAQLEGLEEAPEGEPTGKVSYSEKAKKLLAEAKNEAQNILNEAQDEVERLRAAAYDEAENVKNAARADGYEAGYQEGLAAVREEYQKKEQQLEEYKQAYEVQLQEEQEAFVSNMEHNMVNWLCQMVPAITGVCVDDQKAVMLYIVNRAIKNLDDCKQFVVKVSEVDYAVLELQKEKIYGYGNPNIDIQLFADAKLTAKQCLIETENGVVNASLDMQLSNLNKALHLMIKE